MAVFKESSLNDSVLFKSLNKQAELVTIIGKCIKDGMILDSKYIQEQLIQIKRTRISPLADHVIESFGKGEIVLVYSKVTKVPSLIPFIVLKVKGVLKAFIFVNNYGTISKNEKAGGEEYLNMPMKDLYVLMEGAYTALSYYTYPVALTKNLGLMKISSIIYTNMMLRILNKEYSLSLDQTLYNQVSFCISRFFLDRVWESKNIEINTAYAMNSILNVNKQDLVIVNDSYNEAKIVTIEDLIKFLGTLNPRITMNIRYFTQCYLNLYKQCALFSMECLPYFLFTIESSLIGSFIVNQAIISDICKNIKGVNTFYAELSKVL